MRKKIGMTGRQIFQYHFSSPGGQAIRIKGFHATVAKKHLHFPAGQVIEEHLFVIPHQADRRAVFIAKIQDIIDDTFRIGTPVDVIADENKNILLPDRQHPDQAFQMRKTPMNIPDGKYLSLWPIYHESDNPLSFLLEQGVDKLFALESPEILDSFPDPDITDGEMELVGNANDDASLGCAVQFR